MKPKKLLAIGLSPNTTTEDVQIALSVLLNPRDWFNPRYVDVLQNELVTFLAVDRNRLFLQISGRSAIYDALKLSGVGKGDEVIVQAFTCVATINPIQWLGAVPVFVDIDKATLNTSLSAIKAKVTPKTKAIIVQHTFGLPMGELNELVAFAREAKITVIEDVAHGLGAKLNDKYLGTTGDFGVFSFGRDKIISSVFGGALLVNNDAYLEKMETHQSTKLPVSVPWLIKQLLYSPLTRIISESYYVHDLGRFVHKLGQETGLLTKATSYEEKMCGPMPEWTIAKMPGGLARLASVQLKHLPNTLIRRSEIAKRYQEVGIVPCQLSSHNLIERVWLRFPVLVDEPVKYHHVFKEQGIFIGDWYDQVVAPKEVDLEKTGYQTGSAPSAEEISRQIVNLPTQATMSNEDVQKVIGIFNSIKNANNS